MTERIDDAVIAMLEASGYEVEDMGLEHGDDWRGHWRWVHEDGSFQDWGTSSTSIDAWGDALTHYNRNH